MQSFKETFTIQKDGKDVVIAVKAPNVEQGRKAQLHYNKTFSSILKEGGILRSSLWAYLRQQNLWNDDMQERLDKIIKEFTECQNKLEAGGIKLSEGKRAAMRMKELREEMVDLQRERNRLDVNTVEGQAENAKFNALVSMCMVYNDTGEPYYKSVDEYLEKAGDPEAIKGAEFLAKYAYGWDESHVNNLPENKWLKKWKLVDEKFRLVNKDGKLVDSDGRLINEDGRYIDENNNFVDINGKPVNDDGSYKVETAPFLDDDGNPLEEPTDQNS